MRLTGPKNRLARRQGIDLGLKTPGSKSHARLLKKINVVPGQHGLRTKRKVSERAFQLKEKQKLRFMFGLTEKQLKNYFNQASFKKGNTAMYLARFLEKRLDNIIYRLSLAPTRAAARQLVTHGHIKVDDAIVSIPSFQVRIGNVVTFGNEKTTKIPYIEKLVANQDMMLPSWFEKKALVGKLISEPLIEDIEKQVNLRLVIEYYSR